MRDAIRRDRGQSDAIRGDQRRSERQSGRRLPRTDRQATRVAACGSPRGVIPGRGHVRATQEVVRDVIRGHRRSSEVIRGHRRSSEGITWKYARASGCSGRCSERRASRINVIPTSIDGREDHAYLHTKGHPSSSVLISAHQCSSVLLNAPQCSAVLSRGHHGQSRAITGRHPRQSKAIQGHPRPSKAIQGTQRQSTY